MTAVHPLDRPIWSMLTGRQAHLAEGDARALRIDRGYGVFGVAADTGAAAQAALAALIPPARNYGSSRASRGRSPPERTR